MNEINCFIRQASVDLTLKTKDYHRVRKIITELTDPQRKLLLSIIHNPNSPETDNISTLSNEIKSIRNKIDDGTFGSRRDTGCWKNFCRFFSNFFNGRTSSKSLLSEMKRNNIPNSVGNLVKTNPELKKILKNVAELDDEAVAKNLKVNKDQIALQPLTLDFDRHFSGLANNSSKVQSDKGTYTFGTFKHTVEYALNDGDIVSSRVGIQLTTDQNALVTGIFDGVSIHGDSPSIAISEYLKDNLLDLIKNEIAKLATPLTDAEIYNALNQAFLTCNHNWLQSSKRTRIEENADSAAASACVAIIMADAVWIANVGNTRALLVTDSKVEPLTLDAEVDNDFFADRVVQNGGIIKQGGVIGKVWDKDSSQWSNGPFYLPQAFGCFNFKGVTAAPIINKISLNDIPPNSKIVIGSNDLSRLASGQDIKEFIALEAQNPFSNTACELTKKIVSGHHPAASAGTFVVHLKEGS